MTLRLSTELSFQLCLCVCVCALGWVLYRYFRRPVSGSKCQLVGFGEKPHKTAAVAHKNHRPLPASYSPSSHCPPEEIHKVSQSDIPLVFFLFGPFKCTAVGVVTGRSRKRGQRSKRKPLDVCKLLASIIKTGGTGKRFRLATVHQPATIDSSRKSGRAIKVATDTAGR